MSRLWSDPMQLPAGYAMNQQADLNGQWEFQAECDGWSSPWESDQRVAVRRARKHARERARRGGR